MKHINSFMATAINLQFIWRNLIWMLWSKESELFSKIFKHNAQLVVQRNLTCLKLFSSKKIPILQIHPSSSIITIKVFGVEVIFVCVFVSWMKSQRRVPCSVTGTASFLLKRNSMNFVGNVVKKENAHLDAQIVIQYSNFPMSLCFILFYL